MPLEGSPGDPEGASEASLSGMKRAVTRATNRILSALSARLKAGQETSALPSCGSREFEWRSQLVRSPQFQLQ